MKSTIIFSISAFIYMTILMIVFFTKKYYKSLENKIYSKIIITSFIGLIVEILGVFIFESNNSLLIFIQQKLYQTYLLTWIGLFTLYTIISFKDKKEIKSNLFIILFYVISVIIIFILPTEIYNKDSKIFTYGASINYVYFFSLICIFIIVYKLLTNIKKIFNKKYIPISLFIFIGVVTMFIQSINPAILLTSSMEALITFLMYFTIENPDMKLLEEVHKAKVISDNANEEKTMFLYNITNEIRGITKDINYEADNILNETDNKKVDLNIVNDSAREIKGSTAKFTTMTNEILDISQVDASNIKIYNEKYSIKLILKELITKYKEMCKRSGIEFRTSIVSDIPEVLYGDSVGLKNVMISLLDNSVKYTKKGYIELNVNVIKKQDIARLLITIEDSGIGIKSSEIDKIFNKNKEELKRNNLKNNLFTARKIITLMGGTLIASSTYGKGTTMKIVLDQKIEVIDNKYDKVYDKKKILLIEDSETTYKLITKMLKNTNIIIDRVVLGSEGLDKIRNKEKYDLILVEEELKPLNGYDIIKKLKLIKNFNTKVVLLTKNPNIEYSYLYKDEGFSDYLIKPINRSLLLNIINKYL